MRIKVCLFFSLLGLCCCNNNFHEKSAIHSLVDSLHVRTDKNVIIFTINPNDCINCLYGFVRMNNKISGMPNAKVYVLAVDREIEKEELVKTVKVISLKDSINRTVVWNKELFNQIGKATKNNLPVSLVTIYSYKNDSILFSKPIKAVYDLDEIRVFLN